MARKTYTPPADAGGAGGEIPEDAIPLTSSGFDQVLANMLAIVDLCPVKRRTEAGEYLQPVANFLVRCRNELFPGAFDDGQETQAVAAEEREDSDPPAAGQ